MNKVYLHAYARGYYFGRTMGFIPNDEDMSAEDQAYAKNQGFLDGFAAGVHDFEEIDLPKEALSQLAAEAL